jgi:hypothetical protein
MARNRFICPVIVACLLSAAVLLGGCSPPLPKTWLPSPNDAMSKDRLHVVADTSLTIR